MRSVHLAASDLQALDLVDKSTMRDFDALCLTPVLDLSPDRIRQIRRAAHMSQATFAMTLNVAKTLVSQWERGERKPSGPSAKLLSLADRKGIEAIF